jgi:hypothetical protein
MLSTFGKPETERKIPLSAGGWPGGLILVVQRPVEAAEWT